MSSFIDFFAIIGVISFLVWIYNIFLKKRPLKDSEELQRIIKLINEGQNLFITGGAGTGKSFILNTLRQRYKIAVTSTTGISAININGQTIHSWTGIGIAQSPVETTVKKILSNPVLEKQIKYCSRLAIDEISMLDGFTFDYINEVLKKVRDCEIPFGGIQILLFGDFFQLPPVKKKEKGYCFNSKAWNELNPTPVTLDKIYRQEETFFVETLKNVRYGIVTQDDYKILSSREVDFSDFDSEILHLFSTNEEAENYNSLKLKTLMNAERCYSSKDIIYNYKNNGSTENIVIENPDFLNSYNLRIFKTLEKDCKAPMFLKLKVGCRVILLKNLNFKQKLVNGSTGTIYKLQDDSITINFDNGIKYTMTSKEKFEYWSEGVLKATREQYPLSLAYGVTIHKSQGMTLNKVIIDFNRIFADGQAYVALSRVKTLKGLHIKSFTPNKIVADTTVIDFYKKIETSEITNFREFGNNLNKQSHV